MQSVKIDKLIRSARRTISLEILPDATLIVRAPKNATLKVIDKLLQEKVRWIAKKQQEAKEKIIEIISKEFVDDEEFLYLGNRHRLRIVQEQNETLTFADEIFWLSQNHRDYAKEIFTNWYQQRALMIISERVEVFAKSGGFHCKKIRITEAKTRWGSCNSRGFVNFNWRLIMAPLFVIDYIVVHELAHLKHPNHSKRFWNCVGRLFPDYKVAKKWLNDYGHLLNV